MLISIQAFRNAADPFFFAQAHTRNATILFSTVMRWFVLGACFILFAVSTNLDLLGRLLLRRVAYREALDIVPCGGRGGRGRGGGGGGAGGGGGTGGARGGAQGAS